MSANFGIVEKRLHQVAMKNEYFFPVFVPTRVGKHYYANMSVQEGDVFPKLKFEIKGVHLKSSNTPKAIIKQAHDMLEDITNTTMSGKKLSVVKYLREVADLQRSLEKSIRAGDSKLFRLAEIKSPGSYKKPESSPYIFYELWTKAFEQNYPGTVTVPYPAIKIATTLSNARETKDWLASIEDKELAKRILSWMTSQEKTTLPTILIPLEVAKIHGIPKEILEIMGVRRMISDLTKIFYLILETIGIYFNPDVMVYDQY
jgi:hypothetical protein